LTADRLHTLRLKRDLDWFFDNKRRLTGCRTKVVEAAWSRRPIPEGRCAIQFLFLAPKRHIRLAHDRNKIKRWLREAVGAIPQFTEIERVADTSNLQIILMLRVLRGPTSAIGDRVVDWSAIASDVERIGTALLKEVSQPESTPLPLALRSATDIPVHEQQ
jgi:RNase P protein component